MGLIGAGAQARTQLLATAPRPAQGTLSLALENLSDNHLTYLEEGLDQLIQAMQVKDDEAGMLPLSSRDSDLRE